jgi:1,4-dihydroxy-2-naphthoyl-CoA synthase
MNEILTERSEGILRVELNRPKKRNAMTSSMYGRSRMSSTRRPRTSARVSCSGMAQEIRSAPATIWRIF